LVAFKFTDLRNQCKLWNNGLAYAEFAKLHTFGFGSIKPDLEKAQKFYDLGCEKKSEESCALAKQMKEGTLPKDPDQVLSGIEVSTPETQGRAAVSMTITNVTYTCPGAPSERSLKQAANVKSFVTRHYPSVKADFPEYWLPEMEPLQGRDGSWYILAGKAMEYRPGDQPALIKMTHISVK
ncbi:MAG: hypothetical protein ACI4NA_06065, partial [Succinivibrio sp.]